MQRNTRSADARTLAAMGRPNGKRRSGAAIQEEHVPGVRKVLHDHGYHVDLQGPLTDRLLSAWRNYRRSIKYGTGGGRGTGDSSQPGAHTVKDWNNINPRKYGASSGARHDANVSPPAKKDFVRDANVRTKTHGKAETHAKDLGVKSKKGKTAGVPGVGSPRLGTGPDVNKLLPSSYAETVAAAQFDPQIAEARRALAGTQRDQAQAQKDISSWYGQVEGSQATAGQQDADAGSRARNDVSSMIQAITGSLGQRGGALVAAQGANDLTALAAQGQNQDKYNAELAPILKTAQADAASRQAAMATQEDAKGQGAIQDLLSSRGLTKAKALGDVTQANNSSRQQNFANRQAIFNAGLAAESLGMDEAKTRAQLSAYGLDARVKQAGLTAAKQKASGHPDWSTLNDTDRQTLITRALQTGLAAIPKGAPYDPGHVQNVALAYLRSAGFGSARKLGYKGRVPSNVNRGQIISRLNQAISQAGQTYGAQ